MKTGGEILRQLRKRKGLASKDLAYALGVNRSIVSELENAKRPLTQHYIALIEQAYIFDQPSIDLLKKYAAIDFIRANYNEFDIEYLLKIPLESIHDTIQIAREARIKNNVALAGHVLPDQIALLREYGEKYPFDREKIDELVGIATIEKLETLRHTARSHEIVESTTDDLKLLNAVKYALRDNILYQDLAIVEPYVVKYVASHFSEVSKLISLFSQMHTSHSRRLIIRMAMQISGLSFMKGKKGYEQALQEFRIAQEQAIEAIESQKISLVDSTSVYEAMSFGLNTLRLPDSSEVLNVARDKYALAIQQGHNLKVMEGLLIRTEVNNLLSNNDVDLGHLQDLLNQWVDFSDNAIYIRQRSQVLGRLLRHRNPEVELLGLEMKNRRT